MVVAGTHSGVGKTTVATGIMAALGRRGTKVGAAKVGPDFIDPGYHELAVGRPSRNLDAWICGLDAIRPLAGRASANADILVVEGVMGLFDGALDKALGDDLPSASTAAVASELRAPVLLVIDASAMSQSVAALVHGYSTFDSRIGVAGVILNRVASDSHEEGLRRALEPLGTQVVGCLRRDVSFHWRDRHLGLVPVVERTQEIKHSLERLADAIERSVDLDAVAGIAQRAEPLAYGALPRALPQCSDPLRLGVAGGKAFSFVYPDNLERLEQAGAEIAMFDPLADEGLPEGIDALYAGGGFPETYVEALAANRPLMSELASKANAGMPIWAECGGLLWLAECLGPHRLAGIVPARAEMTGKLTLGYRQASVLVDNPVAAAGSRLRGHEFHYSSCEPPGTAMRLSGSRGTCLEGFADKGLFASYLHLHLGVEVAVAERFVRAAATVRDGLAPSDRAPS
ncbi:MAG: cobyrinate a,c-diamide synthase [Acidimicrobiales bacterium]